MPRIFLSLGSNIEPRKKYLELALGKLDQDPFKLVAASGVYETAAQDLEDQADFLNMAAEVECILPLEGILGALQKIEEAAGKQILQRRGPRTLDLDLLLVGNETRDTFELKLPHERMHQRAFVLFPLSEIAKDMVHPLSGKTVAELLSELPPGQRVVKLGPIESLEG